MRIHHITDLHIPEDEGAEEFQHIRPNVERQLEFIDGDASDLLVISGDLTSPDASLAACQWLEDRIPRGLDTLVLPGNHDDPSLLWDVFGAARCGNPDFCQSRQTDDGKLIFVNSGEDLLADEQLDFVRNEARADDSVLFMHHPPHLVSPGGFMAVNQPLLNHSEVGAALRDCNVGHVFCGHYHNAIDLDCDGFELHLTPSPAFQIDLASEAFKMERFEPTVRVIDLCEGVLRTRLEKV